MSKKEVCYRNDDQNGAINALNSVKEPKNYALESDRDLYGEVDLFSWGKKGKEKIILSYCPQYDAPHEESLHYRNGSFTVYTFGASQKKQRVLFSETESGYPHKTIGSAFRAAIVITKSEIAKYK